MTLLFTIARGTVHICAASTRRLLLAVFLTAFSIAAPAFGQVRYDVVASFGPLAPDGVNPYAGVMQASDGLFYGTTSSGGGSGFGTVFKMDGTGTVTVLHSFTGADGADPRAGLIQASDGVFYGTTFGGGAHGYGTVFKMDTAGILTSLYSFAYADGAHPLAKLVQASDGLFYGTTYQGGASGYGTVFTMDTAGTFTSLHSFSYTDGAYPYAGLIQASDGLLYGMTYQGGASAAGTAFKMDSAGTVTPVHFFSCDGDGGYPAAELIQASDGLFYGTTYQCGGPGYAPGDGYGTVFRMNSAGTITVLHTFAGSAVGGDGSQPYAGLVQAGNGLFYGTTAGGGSGFGTVFKVDTTGTLTQVHRFNGSNGDAPYGGLIQGSDGLFYGMTYQGGASGAGTAFKMDSAGTVTPVHDFVPPTSINGANPLAALTQGIYGAFYGTTFQGGLLGSGTVVKSDNAGLMLLHSFGGAEGSHPSAGLILANDGMFYGTAANGGTSGFGTVFKMDSSGTVTLLHSFIYDDGAYPDAGLIQATDGLFYGATPNGGSSGFPGFGTVFKMDSGGTVTPLHVFADIDGANPSDGVIQASDGQFYGTTLNGGVFEYGTVFKMDSLGTVTVLHSFSGPDGAYPYAGLIQASDGQFYGTTYGGGGNGTVFRMDSAGTVTTLHSFGNSVEGANPYAGLIQASDGLFYGTTLFGGASGFGTVFKMDSAGTVTTLHSFTGEDGANPYAGLVRASDGTFYGTTRLGGPNNTGVIFRIQINNAPVAHNDAFTTDQSTTLSVNAPGVLGNDSDLDGDALSVSTITVPPSHGSLTLNADGSFSYTPVANFSGSDNFSYKASDGSAESNDATVSITVGAANHPPVASNGSIGTTEDTQATGQLQATDADGNPLTFIIVSNGTKGAAAITNVSTGAFTYTPNLNANGTDSFTFKTNDGTADSNTATVSITVTSVNDPPVVINQTASTAEDTAKPITLTASDVDGDALTFSIVTGPSHGTLSGSAPNVTYTPATKYNGPDSFTFTANDGTVDSNVASVNVTVSPVIQQGLELLTFVRAYDLAAGAVRHIADLGTIGGIRSIVIEDLSSNEIRILNVTASGLTVRARITNPIPGHSDWGNLLAVVQDVNGDGVNDIATVGHDPLVTGKDTFFLLSGNQAQGTVIDGNAAALYTIPLNAAGHVSGKPGSPEFLLTDGNILWRRQGATGTVLQTLTVASGFGGTWIGDRNRDGGPDYLTGGSFFSTSTIYAISGSDTNGGAADGRAIETFSDPTTPGLGYSEGNSNIAAVIGDITGDGISEVAIGSKLYRIDADGTNYGRVVVFDGATHAVLYRIEPTQTHTNGVFFGNNVVAVGDLDGDGLGDFIVSARGYSKTAGGFGDGAIIAFSGVDGRELFRAYGDGEQLGDEMIVQIADLNGDGLPELAVAGNRASIWLSHVNHAPTADSRTASTAEDTATPITLTASDVDGDPLTFSIVTGPSHGTLSGSAATLTYTPAANYVGADSFTFKANDGTLDSNAATVSITVTAVNHPPVANNQPVSTAEDTAKPITLTGSDVDGNALTFSIATGPSHGTLTGSAPNLTYTPAANYNGADSFTFKANDGTADSNTATVSITVTAVNDAPVAQNGSTSVFIGASVSGTLVATDIDSSALTYAIATNGTKGTAVVTNASTGAYTYTANVGSSGTDSFTFRANDGILSSNVGTITINIVSNRPPLASNGTLTTPEDKSASGTLTATDPDGNRLTYSIVSNGAKGTATITNASMGRFSYTPGANANGSDLFTFKANDGLLDSNIATVTITITPVNDPPVASDGSLSTRRNTSATGTLQATDIDGNGLTFSVSKAPKKGGVVVDASTGAFTYSPNTNYTGSDSFTFKVSDGTATATGTITITVTP
jgi:uncharacterized repeat protein (TIGR03803 family)/VCBS repeat-containing protein